MKIYSVKGNDFKLDGGAMFGHAPKSMWKNWFKPDRTNRISLSSRSLYVKTKDYSIICETGIGNFLEPKIAKRYGVDISEHKLIKNLKSIDVEETEIDYVILSHLHFDHAGGLISKQLPKESWGLCFPNAKYIVEREQFERADNPHHRDKASFIKGLTNCLADSGRLILVDKEKVDGLEDVVSFYYTEGHTLGQVHSLFNGGKEKVFFAGDLSPGIAWVNLPITMGFDRAPEKLIDEKKEIFDKAVKENWLVFYTHDPVVAVSRISAEKRNYKAVDMLENLDNYSCD